MTTNAKDGQTNKAGALFAASIGLICLLLIPYTPPSTSTVTFF